LRLVVKAPIYPACCFIPLPVSPSIAPALLTEAGLLPSPSIILSQTPSSSSICLEPNEDRDESGWELCIEIDSEWDNWFPPRILTDSNKLGRWECRCAVGRSWWLPLLLGYIPIEVYYALAADDGCELLMRRLNVLVFGWCCCCCSCCCVAIGACEKTNTALMTNSCQKVRIRNEEYNVKRYARTCHLI
jgi:hypothetical protein